MTQGRKLSMLVGLTLGNPSVPPEDQWQTVHRRKKGRTWANVAAAGPWKMQREAWKPPSGMAIGFVGGPFDLSGELDK